ncbi:EDD domain protein, DegV family [Sporobacter termitidis DSM 10068]|uniref:EDD domain protein, DegV family n=1 Tax=Sporobacter termitidis DSM 10068 TaxID=1123282 RepID=A0A1M5VBW7_9FIRM|nr:DegV family protein [Sporobacter termitidis]SHH72423.1 EDD domain protein, DegV family [Sporobacter termitidis DSM 10068]
MVRIITDSTSDITQEDAARLNVTVVPLTVFFGSEAYKDGIDLTKKDFFEKLAVAETLPTTSQIPPGEFTPLFQRYIDAGDEIVGIFISSKLSGTCQSAEVARGLVSEEKIHVIDSLTATFELALLVFEAIRFRDEGKSAAEIAESISGLVKRVRLLAAVDTLKYLRMSGRISTTTAFVGGLLGINPIIAITDGLVVSVGKTRGLRAGLNFIADRMTLDPPDTAHTVVFGHTNAPQALRETADYLTAQFHIANYHEMDIGITVGTHVGPGAAGIAYIARAKE